MVQGQGITSLMPGQAPAAGQAPAGPVPGMKPPMGGPSAGVMDLVGPLKNLPEQVLTMELLNPQSKLEKYAVLAALDQKNRERKTMQAVQGMIAQQQNAQMQGQGTVAQQVAQEAQQPVMAAMGGIMQGYAGGGIVAFSNGGDALEKRLIAQGVPSAFIAQKKREGLSLADIEVEARREGYLPPMLAQPSAVAPQPMTSVISSPEEQVVPEEVPLEQRRARSESIGKVLRMPEIKPAAVAKGLISGERPEFYKEQFQDPEAFMREIAGETRPLPKTALPPEFVPPPPRTAPIASPAPAPSREAVSRTRPPAPPAASGLAALVEKDVPELQTAYAKLGAAAGMTPDQQRMLEEKQAAELGIRREAEAARKQRAEEAFARSAKSYAETLAGQEGLLGARNLFELAASIDPRKGYVLGSLAKGAAGVLAREQEEKKKAQTAYELAQQKFSEEQSALEGIRLATAERDTAILSGNMNAAREAEAKRAQYDIEYRKAVRERAVADRNAAIEAHKAESTRISAQASGAQAAATREATAATREATNFARLQGQLGSNVNNLQQELEKARKAHVAENGPIYLLTKVPGAKLTPEQQASLDKAESDWAAKEKAIERKYMPLINETSKKLYGVPYSQVSGESQGNVMTRADVEATARSSGKTVEEVEAAARAKGFTIKD